MPMPTTSGAVSFNRLVLSQLQSWSVLWLGTAHPEDMHGNDDLHPAEGCSSICITSPAAL